MKKSLTVQLAESVEREALSEGYRREYRETADKAQAELNRIQEERRMEQSLKVDELYPLLHRRYRCNISSLW